MRISSRDRRSAASVAVRAVRRASRSDSASSTRAGADPTGAHAGMSATSPDLMRSASSTARWPSSPWITCRLPRSTLRSNALREHPASIAASVRVRSRSGSIGLGFRRATGAPSHDPARLRALGLVPERGHGQHPTTHLVHLPAHDAHSKCAQYPIRRRRRCAGIEFGHARGHGSPQHAAVNTARHRGDLEQGHLDQVGGAGRWGGHVRRTAHRRGLLPFVPAPARTGSPGSDLNLRLRVGRMPYPYDHRSGASTTGVAGGVWGPRGARPPAPPANGLPHRSPRPPRFHLGRMQHAPRACHRYCE